jgi:phage shock protein PspC (stress-responsive transcriptional regulator)
MSDHQLTRSERDRRIAGVCGGLATWLGLDVIYVRLAFVLLGLASGIGVLLYLILAVITPTESAAEVPGIRFAGDPPYDPARRSHNNTVFFAIMLVATGAWLLLSNIGISSTILAPLILIGLGIWLWRDRREKG